MTSRSYSRRRRAFRAEAARSREDKWIRRMNVEVSCANLRLLRHNSRLERDLVEAGRRIAPLQDALRKCYEIAGEITSCVANTRVAISELSDETREAEAQHVAEARKWLTGALRRANEIVARARIGK